MSRISKLITLVALFMVAVGTASGSQHSASVLRQYPIQNAFEVPPVTNIGITANAEYDRDALSESGLVVVRGSVSGLHSVTLHLSDDQQTLILHPIYPFGYNETVTVILHATLSGGGSLVDSFTFRTMYQPVESQRLINEITDANLRLPTSDSTIDSLPPMKVLIDRGATPGQFYLSNFGIGEESNQNFLLKLDEHGNILQKQNLGQDQGVDFKIQPNKEITFFDNWQFVGLDSMWNVIDTFPTTNGYRADEHDLRLLPDGGYALLAISVTTLDTSQYVDGMVPKALIGGDVIQIFDAHGNETFEWRGIDHYRVADAVHQNLHDSSIDFEHANSLDFDPMGNIIMSNRHLSEVSKISRSTGAFLWRLGGAHNQFSLQNDSIWFSYQHAARLLSNGHLTLFDNAIFDSVTGSSVYVTHSRAVEYELDTTAMIARQVWQWHHNPETFSIAMGYVQRLANQHTIIGWGLNYNYSITEIGPNDSTLFEMFLGRNNASYRVIKDAGPDSLLSVAPTSERSRSLPCSFTTVGSTGKLNILLDKSEMVTVSVYDLLGHPVLPATSAFKSEGSQTISFQIGSLAAGNYFCEVRTPDLSSAAIHFAVIR